MTRALAGLSDAGRVGGQSRRPGLCYYQRTDNMDTTGKHDTTPQARAPRNKGFRLQAAVSFALTFAGLLMAASGVILYLAPRGRDAYLMGWQRLGWDRQAWTDVHLTSCTMFLVLGIAHVFYNWRILWGYVYSKAKRDVNLWRELLVALTLTGVVLVGTLRRWPPMNAVMQWRQEFKYRHVEAEPGDSNTAPVKTPPSDDGGPGGS